MSSHETLGLLLVRDGIITRPQLYDALRLQRQNGRLLGTCLLELGYLAAETLLGCLSLQLTLPALPPGTLDRAAPAALARVPADIATRLRVLPYTWDGHMLGVAVSDGRSIGHLHEIAHHSRSAVGAYVALEVELDAMLQRFYGEPAAPPNAPPSSPTLLTDRPRPARAVPLVEVPTRNFGAALGLDTEEDRPVVLVQPRTPRPSVSLRPPPPAPVRRPPSPTLRPAPRELELSRMPFYDAIEQIYAAPDTGSVGRQTGRALLNYFSRVLVTTVAADLLETLAFAGMQPPFARIGRAQVPLTEQSLPQRAIVYGPFAADPRAGELTRAFGCESAATSLVACLGDGQTPRLVVYADNGAVADLYEDLHDVELLFKEAETALRLLAGP